MVVDAAALVAGVVSLISGVVLAVAPSGGFQGGRGPGAAPLLFGWSRSLWNGVHVWGSFILVALVIVHLALHLKWIACVPKLLRATGRPRDPETRECEVASTPFGGNRAAG